jgi:hypothetical protein
MNDPTPIRDANSQRFVQDFDALADWMQTRIERDRGRVAPKTNPATEMEYTTEWQMESSAEAAHSL